MPTRPKFPIQIDNLPQDYNAVEVQRVMEGMLRRLTDEPEEEDPDPTTTIMEAGDDVLPWVL